MHDAMLLEVHRDRRAGRGRWWGPDGRDYTDLLGMAGLYTPERAAQLTAHSDRTTARPLADVVEEVLGDGEWMAHHGLGLDRVVELGTVGELLVGLDLPGQIRRAVAGQVDQPACYEAVRYLLDRAQTDPDLGYLVGPGTEAFRLLCVAEAARPPLLVCEYHDCRADEAAIHARRAKGRDTGEERALWAPAFGWSLGMLACPDCRKVHSLVSARTPEVPGAWKTPEEWCVYEHGMPERCLVRVSMQDGYSAFKAAIKWAKDNGFHASRVTVDRYPPRGARGVVGYETCPVLKGDKE